MKVRHSSLECFTITVGGIQGFTKKENKSVVIILVRYLRLSRTQEVARKAAHGNLALDSSACCTALFSFSVPTNGYELRSRHVICSVPCVLTCSIDYTPLQQKLFFQACGTFVKGTKKYKNMLDSFPGKKERTHKIH